MHESLKDFFTTIIAPKGPFENILEIGCGDYSIFEDLNLNSQVTAIDCDLDKLNKAPTPKESRVTYKHFDITDATLSLNQSFDLVMDSHCLHCITDEEERRRAFNNIFLTLKSNGLFSCEMMVKKKNGPPIPMRYIADTFEFEKMILNLGFKIEYFLVSPGLSFYHENIECDLLRLVARKE